MVDNFGGRLSYVMSLRGMKQKELARRADVTEATVSRYVNNKRSPDIDFIRSVVSILDVSADYLLGFSENTMINRSSNIMKDQNFAEKYILLKDDGSKISIKGDEQIRILDQFFESLV